MSAPKRSETDMDEIKPEKKESAERGGRPAWDRFFGSLREGLKALASRSHWLGREYVWTEFPSFADKMERSRALVDEVERLAAEEADGLEKFLLKLLGVKEGRAATDAELSRASADRKEDLEKLREHVHNDIATVLREVYERAQDDEWECESDHSMGECSKYGLELARPAPSDVDHLLELLDDDLLNRIQQLRRANDDGGI